MKKIAGLCCALLLLGCTQGRNHELDPVATANAPWQKGDVIVSGFCSQQAIGGCVRIFRGITRDNKILVQDFHTRINFKVVIGEIYNPITDIVDEKFTDPFTVLTVEDARLNLFYVDDGKDGPYREYDLRGRVVEEGAFRNGLKHGHWISRLPRGETEEGEYVDGKKHGIWVFKDGSTRIEETWVHGKRRFND